MSMLYENTYLRPIPSQHCIWTLSKRQLFRPLLALAPAPACMSCVAAQSAQSKTWFADLEAPSELKDDQAER